MKCGSQPQAPPAFLMAPLRAVLLTLWSGLKDENEHLRPHHSTKRGYILVRKRQSLSNLHTKQKLLQSWKFP